MTTIANVGLSDQADSWKAGFEAARQAMVAVPAPVNLMIAFVADHHDPKAAVGGIRSASGDVPLIGCCVPGLFTAYGYSTDMLAVMAVHAEGLKANVVLTEGIRADPQRTGQTVAERLADYLTAGQAVDQHLAALILIDAMSGFSAELMQGITDGLGPICLLAGGAGCDSGKFIKSFQFINDEIRSDAVVAALLHTSAPLGVGVSHGYQPVGQPLVATRAAFNVVYELDGQPAFEVYQRTWAHEVPEPDSEGFRIFAKTHPLGLPQLRGEYIIRDLLRIHPDGALECASTIPENAVVHTMSVDRNGLFTAARTAAQQARQQLAGWPPAAVIVFDCISRLTLLGDDIMVEIDQIRDIVGPETPLLGMFSYGEIATPPTGRLAAFYNKTVVVCALA